jgi:phage gp29-like protein
MDAAIAKVIVGQTASSQGTPGRLGGDDEQGAVRMEVSKADADLVCSSFNRQVARWLTEYNFGPDITPPTVWRRFKDAEIFAADKQALVDNRLSRIGYRPSPERVEEIYGHGYEQFEISPSGGGDLGFAESRSRAAHADDNDQIVDEADAFAAQWERLLGRRVEQVLAYAEESSDLEEFRRKLRGLAAAEPDANVRETIARAGFVGRLWGAYRGRRDVS